MVQLIHHLNHQEAASSEKAVVPSLAVRFSLLDGGVQSIQ